MLTIYAVADAGNADADDEAFKVAVAIYLIGGGWRPRFGGERAAA